MKINSDMSGRVTSKDAEDGRCAITVGWRRLGISATPQVNQRMTKNKPSSSHASVAHTATRPRHKAPRPPCALTIPLPKYLISGPRAFVLQKSRGHLHLVHLSRIPSGIFGREVHPDSEMTRQNHQIVAFHGHGVLWRIVLGTVRGRATPGTPRACCRLVDRFFWVSGGLLAHVDPSRGSRSFHSRRSSSDARMVGAS